MTLPGWVGHPALAMYYLPADALESLRYCGVFSRFIQEQVGCCLFGDA